MLYDYCLNLWKSQTTVKGKVMLVCFFVDFFCCSDDKFEILQMVSSAVSFQLGTVCGTLCSHPFCCQTLLSIAHIPCLPPVITTFPYHSQGVKKQFVSTVGVKYLSTGSTVSCLMSCICLVYICSQHNVPAHLCSMVCMKTQTRSQCGQHADNTTHK